ncbi:2Fe-2S iron-sulfur cluster-binding protein [Nocardioides sp. Root140]|uniref:2Fe-2S iron-sulfur cluster-binding protein n=1 Tax=Nocardioides sp. Root140 TaxID=1736460 RepID=UPI0006F624B6|nr:2Fe-2S iron-sulfur cluster-binding protein [Nocardioides sp. Root140]KQY56428.1 2Fe-2S ferredoxin [Nocardioides sp. Root140]KRF13839.1 2Fe-2S ferredoxin [Nocardioides sp. Soil797]
MSTVTFVEYDGTSHDVDLVEGESLMEIATNGAIPGIDADCGGEAACGTCHIFVDSEWISTTGRRTDEESQMLEMSSECEPNSRLACQVIAAASMDGLKVRLPEYQI